LLAQVARAVVGIEHSGATVQSAACNFPRSNLRFLQGDARLLPLGDACVDLVVSFETIEHFDRQESFVREVRRVLRPGGRFIVSTPDRDVCSPANAPVNPYHVHELTRVEFQALLETSFRHVTIMHQRPVIGSALLADNGTAAAPLVFDRRGDSHFEACAGLPRAPYLVAVASDDELPPLPASLYIQRSDLDTDALHIARLTGQLEDSQTEVAVSTRKLSEVTQRAEQAAQSAEQAAQCAERAARRADAAERAQADAMRQFEALQLQHDHMRSSLRTFLRGYWPLLRRHLFGQRP
jgi:SAM-dependent methyltransferase